MHLNEIINYLDHKFLNEIVPFDSVNPTAENIAAFVLGRLKNTETKSAKACEVEVWESESSSAVVSI